MAVLLIPQPGSAGDPTLTVDQDGNYVISADLSVIGDLTVSGDFTFDGAAFTFPLPLTLGGTGAASAAAARTSLGVEIGTDVQAWSAVLDATTASFLIADETKLDGIEALADVTDATNVAAAGAVMEADTTTAAMGFVIDEDNMASDSATKVPTQQSVKAYADTKQPLNANLTTLAGITPGAAGQAILADATKDDVNDYLGVIQNVATNFGAVGDGTTDNATVFGTAKAAGGLVFIPKPATGYEFTTTVGSTDAVSAWLPDPSQTWAQLTDSGQFSLWRGRSTSSIPTGSNIWRFSDRAFFGYAASAFAGDQHVSSDGGVSWNGDTTTPSYLAKNAGVLFMSGQGDTAVLGRNQPYGFVAALRSSDLGGSGPIGLASCIVADEAGVTCWGGIQELQRESGAGNLYGWEIAAKNKGQGTNVATPVSLAAGGPAGVYGIWLHAAGHEDFGGVPVPCTAGIAFVSSPGPTIDGSWNSGIVFGADAITNGEAIAMASEPTIGASHRINWLNSSSTTVFSVTSNATDSATWTLSRINTGLNIAQGSVNIALFQTIASGVNYLGVTAGPTGFGPLLTSIGSDTNSSGRLRGKGTGGWIFQDGGAAAKFQYNTTGIGFFAATPVARGALAAPSGTITRTTFDTASVTTAQLAERVYAMINDLRAYGLFS